MSEYKRFTEKIDGENALPLRNEVCGFDLPKWMLFQKNDNERFVFGDAVERFAELEDDLEDGNLIRLPCKVGDTVYAIKKKALRSHWDEHRYIVDEWDKWKVCELPFSLTLWEVGGVIGKDYFLTSEEAEEKLKEKNDGR